MILLLSLTALASRDPLSTSGGSRPISASPPGATISVWPLMLVAAVAVIALFGVLVYAMWAPPRRRKPDELVPSSSIRRVPWPVQLALLVLPLIVVGIIIVVASSLSPSQRPSIATDGQGHPRGQGAPALSSPRGGGAAPGLAVWIPVGAVLLVASGGLLVVARSTTARRNARSDARANAATVVRTAIEGSLADLGADPDPRRAVIAAYARMEGAFAAVGVRRGAAEAPREYLIHALAALDVPAAPVTRLTDLFERAKFSRERIGPETRDEAMRALAQLHDELEVVA